MNFGEQVKKIRTERNMTQQDMADKLNVSRQAVSNWENDKNLPDIEMLITMAQVFQITLDELILGGTQMNNMTEKLIRDGSTNNRIKMNLLGTKIGGVMIALGLICLVIALFAPVSMENYWVTAFSIMMLCGVITFLVTGLKNVDDIIKNRKTKNWIIAVTVAVVYLFVSILTSGWQYTWLIWAGYAVYRLVEGKINNKQ